MAQQAMDQLGDSAKKAAGRISQAQVQNRNANQCGGMYSHDTNMGKKVIHRLVRRVHSTKMLE